MFCGEQDVDTATLRSAIFEFDEQTCKPQPEILLKNLTLKKEVDSAKKCFEKENAKRLVVKVEAVAEKNMKRRRK